jgi:hypothetical protein
LWGNAANGKDGEDESRVGRERQPDADDARGRFASVNRLRQAKYPCPKKVKILGNRSVWAFVCKILGQ